MANRIVIGLRACQEVLTVRPGQITKIYFRSNWEGSNELSQLAAQTKGLKVSILALGQAQERLWGSSHQGVAMEVGETPELDYQRLDSSDVGFLVALDQVTDPHNLGAVLRSAWLMGASAVITTKDRGAPPSSVVSKVACGGMEHVPVEVVTNLVAWLKSMKEKGFWVYGFDSQSKQSFWEEKFSPKSILVFGSEVSGMRKATIDVCDQTLSIPQKMSGASYNISVSAALGMAEFNRKIGK